MAEMDPTEKWVKSIIQEMISPVQRKLDTLCNQSSSSAHVGYHRVAKMSRQDKITLYNGLSKDTLIDMLINANEMIDAMADMLNSNPKPNEKAKGYRDDPHHR